MPSPTKDVSLGASFTFGSTGIDDVPIEDFTPPPSEADLLPWSDQATTDVKKYHAAPLKEGGDFSCAVYHNQDYDYDSEIGTEASLVLTMPSGATYTFTAILYRYAPQNFALNDRQMADVSFRRTSSIAVAAA